MIKVFYCVLLAYSYIEINTPVLESTLGINELGEVCKSHLYTSITLIDYSDMPQFFRFCLV